MHETFTSLALTTQRVEKLQQRAADAMGWGDTVGGLAVAQEAMPRLVAAFASMRVSDLTTRGLRIALTELSDETLALCTLQTLLHSIGAEETFTRAAVATGQNINHERWAAGWVLKDRKLAKRIEERVKKKHRSLAYRRQAARSLAKRHGYQLLTENWRNPEFVQVGTWAINTALEALPDLFVLEVGWEQVIYPTITEGALSLANDAFADAIRNSPVFLPDLVPPIPWTRSARGGPTDKRMQHNTRLIRSHYSDTAKVTDAAIASGQMQRVLDAINSVQAVPWRINTRVLAVIKQLVTGKVDVKGLPRSQPYERAAYVHGMTDLEEKLWKIKAHAVKQAERARVSQHIRLTQDIATAEEMTKHTRFYTACNLDWRGRVYCVPDFNFQRDDRVRALFEFADGAPIGEEGLWWIKVHVANCGDFNKISKRPFEERVQWTNENMYSIAASVEDPLTYKMWMTADKPFLFLAACFEIVTALREGPAWITHLPVSWDGSCSGLQHLCAMTRAPEGAFVNLSLSDTPQDVYQRVADACAVQIKKDAEEGEEDIKAMAQYATDYGVGRSLVKRNVMTFSYSSKAAGMANQQDEDLMAPLTLKVMAGELEDHPFGAYAHKAHPEAPSAIARYLAQRVYGSIGDIVKLPAEAMGFLQKLARAAASAGKHLRWVAPTGLPWCNRYHPIATDAVRLWLHDRGVRKRYDTLVAVGHDEREVAKVRASNGVAPNFVHANDGAHLALTVNQAVQENITNLALVHDSFGCLAPQSTALHKIIRETLVRMYEEHDVLQEVLDQAREDLAEHPKALARLPEAPPTYGNLNLKDLINARYAFA